jgi:hypothetical protein
MGRVNLSLTASDACRARNPEIFGDFPPETVHKVLAKPEAPRRAMNKTEARMYGRLLATGHARRDIFPQPCRFFRLSGGGTYTPDFLVFDVAVGVCQVIEVKGGYRGPGWEQGVERYKRAALEYGGAGSPFRFSMYTWDRKHGEWKDEAWQEQSR